MTIMKKRNIIFLTLVSCLALVAVPIASGASDTTIPWFVFSSGGSPAASAGGEVSLNASLGQAVIGPSSSAGGEVQLNAGFWQAAASAPPDGYYLMLPLVVR